jgi:glycosyltransferase involved in cell wall biosynthesis
VLEAMALGTPVLATTKGVEGLDVVPGVHALVADEPEELARLALQLMDDPQLQRRLSAAARECVETQYDYAAIIAELGRVCEEIAAAWERPA